MVPHNFRFATPKSRCSTPPPLTPALHKIARRNGEERTENGIMENMMEEHSRSVMANNHAVRKQVLFLEAKRGKK
ncbi:hypothetical protein CFE70_009512 [Pyrenophora teres f. teres 0-1]